MTENDTPATKVSGGRVMTLEELLALPPTVNVTTAARALGISAHKAYALIKDGTFPVDVLTLGQTAKVPTASLWEVLGVSTQPQR